MTQPSPTSGWYGADGTNSVAAAAAATSSGDRHGCSQDGHMMVW